MHFPAGTGRQALEKEQAGRTCVAEVSFFMLLAREDFGTNAAGKRRFLLMKLR